MICFMCCVHAYEFLAKCFHHLTLKLSRNPQYEVSTLLTKTVTGSYLIHDPGTDTLLIILVLLNTLNIELSLDIINILPVDDMVTLY